MAVSHSATKTPAETALAAAFASARTALPGGPALAERRDAAYRRFEAAGLPSHRVEEWKYTDLKALMRDAKPLAKPATAKPAGFRSGSILADLDAHRVAIVNGAFAPGWSDGNRHDPGVVLSELFAWLADNPQYRLDMADRDDVAVALNGAFMTGGVAVTVRANAKVAKPIHIAHVLSGDVAAAVYPRVVVTVEPGAQVTLVESFEGPAELDYQVNTLLDLTVGAGARVDYVKLGSEGAKALHVATMVAELAADAQFESFAFTTGGAVVRDQGFVRISGERAKLAVRGARLLRDHQHVDTTLVVDHAAAHGESRELFKTVLDDKSRGIFQGKIVVRPHAQKTDGKMATHALLLSEHAEADNKPELEIYADDVQCGHGATSGALDDNLKFYLMSRGIGEKEAETLLIQAFVGEAVDAVAHETIQAALMAAVTGWLEARGLMDQILTAGYDIERIRADFPALAMQVYGKPLVYLDNAASAQKPKAVLDRIQHAYTYEYANVHRGLHYLANAATEAYEGAREKVRGFLNAERAEEIIFTRNATEAINLAAYTFGRERVKEGDEIVLSIMEHHSNIVPWHFLRERHGAVLKWAPVDDDGNFLIDEFEKLLSPRTKLVAITQMSNALGTVVPVKEVVKLAHARGIPVLVDGSQAAVHLDIDVRDIDCDFYVFTGHKLYGPSGIGVLYGKYAHLAAMPPFNGGGEMIREVSEDRVTYGDPPHRFEAGTPSIVQAIGLGAAIDYVNSIGKARIRAHEQALVRYAHERLAEDNAIKIFGHARDKGAIVSFEMKGAHPHDVATIIDRAGVAVRAGTHCTMPLLARFGVTATCRASFALYNTPEEVDALAQALRKAKEFLT